MARKLLFTILMVGGLISFNTQAQIVSPRQFGAKGDGVADDTKAIQKALDCAGTVFFEKGVYKTTSKLIIKSHTSIVGEAGTIIKPTKDSFVLYNEHSQKDYDGLDVDILIDGISIDASEVNAISEYSAGIYMCGVADLTIRNCNVSYVGGDGIYLGVAPSKIRNNRILIDNCSFLNCGRSKQNPRQSIAIVAGDNVYIRDCQMTNNREQAYAIDFEPNNQDEGGTIYVSGCVIRGSGISCGGNKQAHKVAYISNCDIDNAGLQSMTLSFSNMSGSIKNCTITSAFKYNAITIFNSPFVEIVGNTINGGSASILITDGSDACVIKKNVISGSNTGIYVIRSSNVKILTNTLMDINSKGVYARVDTEGTVIKNNKIQSGNTDIYVLDGHKTLIKNNVCRSSNAGIYLTGDSVTISRNITVKDIVATGKQQKLSRNALINNN